MKLRECNHTVHAVWRELEHVVKDYIAQHRLLSPLCYIRGEFNDYLQYFIYHLNIQDFPLFPCFCVECELNDRSALQIWIEDIFFSIIVQPYYQFIPSEYFR